MPCLSARETPQDEPRGISTTGNYRVFLYQQMTETQKNSVFEMLAPILQIDGIELVDVETQGKTLRLLVHKPGALSVADCQAVNQVVHPILAVHQYLTDCTQLEVASPGVDRPLRTARDFQRNRGRTVHIKAAAENDRTYELHGTIMAVLAGKVVLAQTSGEQVSVEISQIRNAHIKLNW